MVYINLSAIIIASTAVAAILFFVLAFFIFRHKDSHNKEEKVPPLKIDKWIVALGGKENIIKSYIRGSRLSIELHDKEIVNRDELTSLGVKSVIAMSDKIILVIEHNGQQISDSLNNLLN